MKLQIKWYHSQECDDQRYGDCASKSYNSLHGLSPLSDG
jgi:hypothetical protein